MTADEYEKPPPEEKEQDANSRMEIFNPRYRYYGNQGYGYGNGNQGYRYGNGNQGYRHGNQRQEQKGQIRERSRRDQSGR